MIAQAQRSRRCLFGSMVAFGMVGLLGYLPYTRAEGPVQECYTTTQNICSTTCMSTGGWWQCDNIVPDGYNPGTCGTGNRYCYEGMSPCSSVLGCGGQNPPNYASCTNGGAATYCVAMDLPIP